MFETNINKITCSTPFYIIRGGRLGHDRMVVGFTTIYAISGYYL